MPSQHNNPKSGQVCAGGLVWGRSHSGEIRRECPVCGYREAWQNKVREWHSRDPNPHPGSSEDGGSTWVDGS